MRKNTALAAWRAGGRTIGGWISTSNSYMAEVMASLGFDWLCVDLQHGLLDYTDLLHILPAISTTDTVPIVRVASNNAADIGKALDAGAMGVIVPLVNTGAEAAAAVAACKYPPAGGRSFGPTRAGLYGRSGYAREANDEIACIVMIETPEGIENLEEIVATPGLGGVYIGPSDLAYALGLPPIGDTEEPLHMSTCHRIRDACRGQGVPVGIHTGGLAWAQRRLEAGFNFVTLGSDVGWLTRGASSDLASARAGLEAKAAD